MNAEIIGTIMAADTKQLFDLFRTLNGTYPEYQTDYQTVRYGKKIKFDIHEKIKADKKKSSTIRELPKNKQVIINGKKHKIDDYWTEIEDREDTMRVAIMNSAEMNKIIKPRNEE